ncbi:MAG: prolipoprotein diacylglyceryl transferase, partial [Corynebacterium kroppenstedtii]|nr:prolipoprotein diacylglyceryl transferase [Corynebacterium kroppenstedtii]
MTLLAAIPSPSQGVWMVGGFPIRGYALSILVGILVAVLWSQRRYAARGGNREVVLDVALAAVPAGIIGGRLYHLATDWRTYWGPNG